jgi:hypothetical protein
MPARSHTWQEAVVQFTTEVLSDNVKPAPRSATSYRWLDGLLRDSAQSGT